MSLNRDSRIGIFLGGTSGLGQQLERLMRQSGVIDFSIVLGSSIPKHARKGNQMLIPCDLQYPRSVRSAEHTLFEQVYVHGFMPAVVVWTAGKGEKAFYFEQTQNQRDEIFNINYYNAKPIIVQAIDHLRGHKKLSRPVIVVAGSTSSRTPRMDEVNYCEAHAAKRQFAESLQLDPTVQEKMDLMYLLLGGMKTPLWDKYLAAHPEFLSTYNTFNDPAKVAKHVVSEIGRAPRLPIVEALRGQFV